jgi:hypothetical protein
MWAERPIRRAMSEKVLGIKLFVMSLNMRTLVAGHQPAVCSS